MKEKERKINMPLTIRPLNSGYIPTKPLEYWYHFSCKKFVEKLGITNDSDQLPDFTFLIEGGDQLILVDTGMSWTEHADKYHMARLCRDRELMTLNHGWLRLALSI